MDFADWLDNQREAGNCPMHLDTLTDEWSDFPLEHLKGSVKNDHTVECDDIARVAQYVDFDSDDDDDSDGTNVVDTVQTRGSNNVRYGNTTVTVDTDEDDS